MLHNNRKCPVLTRTAVVLATLLPWVSAFSCGLMTEGEALNAIGSAFVNFNWPTFTDDFCSSTQSFLTCENGHVTEISCPYHGGVVTAVPEEVSCLPQLRIFSVGNAGISSVPEAICDSPALQELSLPYNAIVSVPNCIGTMSTLRKLVLDENPIDAFDESLCTLTGLTDISFFNTKLTAVPDCIATMTALRTVSFRDNTLKSFPSISTWTSLTSLNLEENELTQAPQGLDVLSALDYVSLANNQIISLPSSFGVFNPTELVLKGNKLSEIPASYCELTRLTKVELHNNEIAKLPDCFDQLQNVVSVEMNGNGLTSIPPSMSEMALVETFTAEYNMISGPFDVGKYTSLKLLRLDHNNLSQAPTGWSPSHTELTEVYLGNNVIEEFPTDLLLCPKYTSVHFSSNSIETLPAEILTASLYHVRFNDNKIKGDLTFASDMLVSLDLVNNEINAIDVSNCPHFDSLNIKGNPLRSMGPLPNTVTSLSFEGTLLSDFPNFPNSLNGLIISNSCVSKNMAGLLSVPVYYFDAKCSYVKETSDFTMQALIDHAGRGIVEPLTTDYSTCPWLHCPNAQEDPVAPGREEISFNEFGPCRAGYECSGVGPGTPCENGKYSTGGATTCSDCSGWRQITGPNHDKCVPLTGDQFADADHIRAVTCGDGSFMMQGVCVQCVRPFKCPGDGLMAKCDSSTAEYQDEKGQSVCKTAEDGFYVRSDHSGVESCPIGHYCVDGVKKPCGEGQYQDKIEQGECIDVPEGSYTDSSARDRIKPCEPGFSCRGGSAPPEPCPASSYSVSGSASCSSCEALTDTSYCAAESISGHTVSVLSECPADSYITDSTRTGCIACESNYKCDGTLKHDETASFTGYAGTFLIGLAILGAVAIFAYFLVHGQKSKEPREAVNQYEFEIMPNASSV